MYPTPLMHFPIVPHGLLVRYDNHLFNTLLDTGATCSFIDVTIAHQLGIAILPSSGRINLASTHFSTPRIGITSPLVFTPILIMDTLRVLTPYTHAFELIELPHYKYQFMIGMDLIRRIFPRYIPTSVLLSPNVITHVDRRMAATADITSSLIHIPIPRSNVASTTDSISRNIVPAEGAGTRPSEEEPIRVSTFTPAVQEKEYSQERNCILRSPLIINSLKTNEAISSFCTLPESTLTLKLDPTRGTPAQLYTRQYPLSQRLITAADEVIQRWITAGKIIRAPPGCPYNNPLMVAPKKDENGNWTGIRVCLDTRKLNAVLVDNDHFEIPLIRSVLDNLAGCKMFGEFDLAEAYLQFPLHPSSRPYTAFTWKRDQYMFAGCPFGLNVMPSHFQRIMSYIFRNLPFTCPYFDNLPFGSHSWPEHAEHTLAIIERLNYYNLKIKPSSVKIGQSQLNCLGHLLTETGIAVSHDKLAKIQEWPLPKTGKQLASFLGLITFVRQHVRHFADVTANLESIKRTKGDIIWTPDLTKSFELIRHAIAHAPLLSFPDFNKSFYVATDASCLGIGGVLYQPDTPDEDIHERNIIAICSKKLNDTQRRYSTYKKELYAIVYCLRQFHAYIWGHHKLVIITDHMPLTHILTSASLAHALQQWLDVILDYHFTIKHRPGVLHVLPDALSRMYEACYTSAWGVPTQDLHQIIDNLQLPIDIEMIATISQPPLPQNHKKKQLPRRLVEQPLHTGKPRTIHASSASVSGGRELVIDLTYSTSSSETDESDDETVPERDENKLPQSDRLIVTDSSIRGAGYGLFSIDRQPFRTGDHICNYGGELIDVDEFWNRYPDQRDARYVLHVGGRWYRDAINDRNALGRYANTSPHGNATFVCSRRTKTGRLVATRTINYGDEILVAYGIGNRRSREGRASAVVDLPDAPDASHPAPSSPTSVGPTPQIEDKELHLLVELERRGKVAPTTEQERHQLIDTEHLHGHFGRDAIYRKLYREGYWWPGMRNTIQERVRDWYPMYASYNCQERL